MRNESLQRFFVNNSESLEAREGHRVLRAKAADVSLPTRDVVHASRAAVPSALGRLSMGVNDHFLFFFRDIVQLKYFDTNPGKSGKVRDFQRFSLPKISGSVPRISTLWIFASTEFCDNSSRGNMHFLIIKILVRMDFYFIVNTAQNKFKNFLKTSTRYSTPAAAESVCDRKSLIDTSFTVRHRLGFSRAFHRIFSFSIHPPPSHLALLHSLAH